MSARPWYKRYPADFIAGTLALTLEEKGAYSIVLDLIYDRGEPIDDDPQWIARVCGCSTRKWKSIRLRLIEFGKITIENGRITNKRAEKEAENNANEARKLSESGSKGAEKTNEKKSNVHNNNDLAWQGPQEKSRHTRSQKPEARKEGAAPPSPEKKDDGQIPDLPAFLNRNFKGELTSDQRREKWLHNIKNYMLRQNGGNIELVHRVIDAYDRGEPWAKNQVNEIDRKMRAA